MSIDRPLYIPTTLQHNTGEVIIMFFGVVTSDEFIKHLIYFPHCNKIIEPKASIKYIKNCDIIICQPINKMKHPYFLIQH